MTTNLAGRKLIYFYVHDKLERAEFSELDELEDIKELFRSAASATKRDIIKLVNSSGSLIAISPRLPSNTQETAYHLEVVASCPKYNSVLSSDVWRSSLSDLERRLSQLEEQVLPVRDNQSMDGLSSSTNQFREPGNPPWLSSVLDQVDDIRKRLQRLEQHQAPRLPASRQSSLSDSSQTLNCPPSPQAPFRRRNHASKTGQETLSSTNATSKTAKEKEINDAWIQFQQYCGSEVSAKQRAELQKACFNNWAFTEPELMLLVREMLVDLGLPRAFRIPMTRVEKWIGSVHKHYNSHVAFHNFKHAFMVTQMMYALICTEAIACHLSDLERFTLIFSSLCHDLDHPGLNNTYQVNARTELAIRYNDISPLENHHSCLAFSLMAQDPESDIIAGLSTEEVKYFRDTSISLILATDMAKHASIVSAFKAAVDSPEGFDWSSSSHKQLFLQILIKVADISNEVRPAPVADLWLDALLEEFFSQSDTEKLEGLPFAPFMDRDKVTKECSQIGFIKFVILPLFDSLVQLIPSLQSVILSPVQSQLCHYENVSKPSSSPLPSPSKSPTSLSFTPPLKRKTSGVTPPTTGTSSRKSSVGSKS